MTPFLRLTIPAVIGVLVGVWGRFPLALLAAFTAVLWVMGLMTWRREGSGAGVMLFIVLAFALIARLHTTGDPLPKGRKLDLVLQVTDPPVAAGRWMRTTAYVDCYRPAGTKNEWTQADTRILLSVDSSYRLQVGDQIACRAWVNPIDTIESSYRKLMRHRGLSGQGYLTPGNLVARSPHISKTPRYYASRLQAHATGILDRLDLSPAGKAVTVAMTTGVRNFYGDELRTLRSDYSRTGTAHVLAVSGLHVGIVFVLLNILLYLLPVYHRGHIAKNALAILCIWLYAAMAGLSPSVVRAAFMFSGAQVALASSRTRNPLNIILGTGFVMLALDPNYLFDISFQLSYAAVLAITLAYQPIYQRMKSRNRLLNAITGAFLVGLVATLGTAPLVSYTFGNVPAIGLVVNPLVVLTAHVIVFAALLWVLVPLPALQPVASAVLEWAAGFQNAVVAGVSDLRWGSWQGSLPGWGVAVVYAVYVGAAVWYYTRGKRRELTLGYVDR